MVADVVVGMAGRQALSTVPCVQATGLLARASCLNGMIYYDAYYYHYDYGVSMLVWIEYEEEKSRKKGPTNLAPLSAALSRHEVSPLLLLRMMCRKCLVDCSFSCFTEELCQDRTLYSTLVKKKTSTRIPSVAGGIIDLMRDTDSGKKQMTRAIF